MSAFLCCFGCRPPGATDEGNSKRPRDQLGGHSVTSGPSSLRLTSSGLQPVSFNDPSVRSIRGDSSSKPQIRRVSSAVDDRSVKNGVALLLGRTSSAPRPVTPLKAPNSPSLHGKPSSPTGPQPWTAACTLPLYCDDSTTTPSSVSMRNTPVGPPSQRNANASADLHTTPERLTDQRLTGSSDGRHSAVCTTPSWLHSETTFGGSDAVHAAVQPHQAGISSTIWAAPETGSGLPPRQHDSAPGFSMPRSPTLSQRMRRQQFAIASMQGELLSSADVAPRVSWLGNIGRSQSGGLAAGLPVLGSSPVCTEFRDPHDHLAMYQASASSLSRVNPTLYSPKGGSSALHLGDVDVDVPLYRLDEGPVSSGLTGRADLSTTPACVPELDEEGEEGDRPRSTRERGSGGTSTSQRTSTTNTGRMLVATSSEVFDCCVDDAEDPEVINAVVEAAVAAVSSNQKLPVLASPTIRQLSRRGSSMTAHPEDQEEAREIAAAGWAGIRQLSIPVNPVHDNCFSSFSGARSMSEHYFMAHGSAPRGSEYSSSLPLRPTSNTSGARVSDVGASDASHAHAATGPWYYGPLSPASHGPNSPCSYGPATPTSRGATGPGGMHSPDSAFLSCTRTSSTSMPIPMPAAMGSRRMSAGPMRDEDEVQALTFNYRAHVQTPGSGSATRLGALPHPLASKAMSSSGVMMGISPLSRSPGTRSPATTQMQPPRTLGAYARSTTML
mmetsp:Transcript_37494/g.83446  ORF Transcript_37494/g.83446 Transcript_37494/m.83446 type:complete len:724 (-) Transcript_37494:2216-4387(-)|eukprot:CAMPEP_0202895268 /NCGR_PEP_ID=MMETSP1392-20130828/4512_1 /ASSEMBLY_ACC=CAM_ASM_000868 /TAXON_ID=225041 /ORGANISM="Chlamydomonas chlamydogama, Strain SAG 11-48b" /LENGTH=723 /DNA_ID=CAMNT_0049580225 /DNA_START=200 /DNA_END=2371 /DNA_ORIENTATION=+